ncbi:hypothetical protein psyc5s11_44830 [Clostridium gelidum]|uniref:Uncharacterized protein n=1 Tax=Clostridium gelidum TaxID=704125 RepID=A0ABM7T8W5_9CLOT|nr:hypothetical protein [Clostridium gelidum]BCZ48416.1 hypothetical protein psyc5s11_44830 [Clostridium gelidum]
MIGEYEKTEWQDHIVESPFAFVQTVNTDGSINLAPKQGEILQQGTPVSANNLNHLEEGVYLNYSFLKELFDEIMKLKLDVLTLKNVTINDMSNNMFFISFATLDDIKLKSGIYDSVNKKIYV